MASYGLTTSESFVSGSSSNDEGWQDDAAEDLDTFVRLSKAGHFKRAEQFFHAFLGSHASDFAVAVQYAENLIEQGAFNSATKVLTALLLHSVDMDDEKRTILRLLLSTAWIYIFFDVEGAESTAVNSLKEVGEVLIEEEMSPLRVSDRDMI